MSEISEITADGEYRITIRCESDGYPNDYDRRAAKIEIDLGAMQRDYVGDAAFCSNVRLQAAEQSFEWQGMLYGHSLKHFANELERMHASLNGSARLDDWDCEKLLCLTVIHRGRGQIAIGGRFEAATFWTHIASEDRFVQSTPVRGRSGIVTSFEGFVLDQSFVPPIVSAIRRFLGDDPTGRKCVSARCS
jgi:hypothetical protein